MKLLARDRTERDTKQDARKIIEALEAGDILPFGNSEAAWFEAASALLYRWRDAHEGEGLKGEHRTMQTALVGVIGFIEDGKPDLALQVARGALGRPTSDDA